MDYLLVAIASVLFPYILNLTGVEYQTYVGMLASLQKANNYKLNIVDKNSKFFVSKSALITYTGYGVRPDFFIDYNIHKGRLWLSPTFGWEPLSTGIEFTAKIKGGSGSSSTNIIHYNKTPYMGLKVGVKVFESNPESNNWYNSFGLIPYVFGGFVPISYESEAYYQSNHEKRYNFYYGAGLKVEVQGPWAVFAHYKYLNFNTNGSSLDHQVRIKESEIQFGIAYWFRSDNKKSKIDRTNNYDNIIHTINSKPKNNIDLPKYVSPYGTVIKDKNISPSYSNIKQTNTIYENNQRLKENNKLLEKAQKTKAKENYNLNFINNDDL